MSYTVFLEHSHTVPKSQCPDGTPPPPPGTKKSARGRAEAPILQLLGLEGPGGHKQDPDPQQRTRAHAIPTIRSSEAYNCKCVVITVHTSVAVLARQLQRHARHGRR